MQSQVTAAGIHEAARRAGPYDEELDVLVAASKLIDAAERAQEAAA